MSVIPYGKQFIDKEDIDAVVKVLKSDFLTQGPKIEEFETEFAKYVGSKFAVAVSNGTAALHLCNLALGVKPGDRVITTPITFAASANSVRYVGGEVCFIDINPENYLLDLDKLEFHLKSHPEGYFKGIIPVNFAGRVIDLERLHRIAKKHQLWIIEDGCHSPGGFFNCQNGIKQYSGNSVFSDLTIFSFHPVKHIACGEGGMITTNDKNLYHKLLKLRTHGITKVSKDFINTDFKEVETEGFPNWYMEMHDLGYNYRLSDINAALGISQLKKAKNGIKRRRKIASKYYNFFKNKKYILNQSGLIDGHAYHLYIIEIQKRYELYNFLRQNKIFTQVHYIPCHLMPYYRNLGWKVGDVPNAENYYSNCLSLPMYPSMKDEEIDFVLERIEYFFKYEK